MNVTSQILHKTLPLQNAGPATTPIFQTSAFRAGSPYFYSRNDNPNVAELEQVVALLENAKHGVAFGCGMAAIYATLDLVSPGEVVVLNQLVYGCSFRLFHRASERRGFRLVVLDLSEEAGIRMIPDDVKMVFFETPTNPFLRSVSIRRVASATKAKNPLALIVVDNTWATPLFQHPLEHGADVSIHSGTKYLSGHSDVMSGIALTDRDELDEELRKIRFYGGLVLSPHDAWLVRRSLQTLDIRLRHQQGLALKMKRYLEAKPEVERVYYPNVDGEQLRGYAGIVFFDLRADLSEHYDTFRDSLALFGTGTGMACVTSMVAQPYTGSHASMSEEEKCSIGLGRNVIRLCFGLENGDDLITDLDNAFNVIAGLASKGSVASETR